MMLHADLLRASDGDTNNGHNNGPNAPAAHLLLASRRLNKMAQFSIFDMIQTSCCRDLQQRSVPSPLPPSCLLFNMMPSGRVLRPDSVFTIIPASPLAAWPSSWDHSERGGSCGLVVGRLPSTAAATSVNSLQHRLDVFIRFLFP